MIGSGQIGSSHDFRKKQEVTQKAADILRTESI